MDLCRNQSRVTWTNVTLENRCSCSAIVNSFCFMFLSYARIPFPSISSFIHAFLAMWYKIQQNWFPTVSVFVGNDFLVAEIDMFYDWRTLVFLHFIHNLPWQDSSIDLLLFSLVLGTSLRTDIAHLSNLLSLFPFSCTLTFRFHVLPFLLPGPQLWPLSSLSWPARLCSWSIDLLFNSFTHSTT